MSMVLSDFLKLRKELKSTESGRRFRNYLTFRWRMKNV